MGDQQEFDFGAWVSEAQTGLAHLQQRREELLRQREEVDAALAQTCEEISALEVMLQAHGAAAPAPTSTPEPAPKKPKVTGIKKEARLLAETIPTGVKWKEEQLVKMVQERLVHAPEASIRQALHSLCKDRVFARTGKRGWWIYETLIGLEPVEGTPAPQEAPEPEEHPQAMNIDLEPQAAEEHPEKPPANGVYDVIKALEKEMGKRKQFEMGDASIGWIAADMSVDPKVVREALRVMVQGKYEFGYDGSMKVLRHKAKPGSKEELKRTKVGDNPLFPGADRPGHA